MATLIFTVIAAVAAVVGAYFAYPAWCEGRRKVALRLGLRHAPGYHGDLTVADVRGRGLFQVVFGLTLYNDGDREARNWRVRLVPREEGTELALERAPSDPRLFRGPDNVGGRWEVEVLAASPGDIVAPKSLTALGGRHFLCFPEKPSLLCIDFELNTDGMPTVEGFIRCAIDWQTRGVTLSIDQRARTGSSVQVPGPAKGMG